jgi:hypothetical protein
MTALLRQRYLVGWWIKYVGLIQRAPQINTLNNNKQQVDYWHFSLSHSSKKVSHKAQTISQLQLATYISAQLSGYSDKKR